MDTVFGIIFAFAVAISAGKLLRWLDSRERSGDDRLLEDSRGINHSEDVTLKAPHKILINLTPVGGAPTICDCQLLESHAGAGIEFEAEIRLPTGEMLNRIFENQLPLDEPTSGTLSDGRQYQGRIGFISSYEPVGPNVLVIKGFLTDFVIVPEVRSAQQPQKWVFQLANVKLEMGELKTVRPLPPEAPPGAIPGWTLDSIEFLADRRKWRLTDTTKSQRRDIPKSELIKPLMSGVLTTEWLEGDTDEHLSEIAQDVCNVLSVAMSRSVNWVSYAVKRKDGTTFKSHTRSTWLTGFDKHGFSPVGNYEPFSLKSLLELSLPVISAEREWYSRTLGMLNQAQLADMIDVRCSILYTLADRISTRVVQKPGKAEIDPELKSRARKGDFVAELHTVLKKLSPSNWSNENTEAVIAEIKRWNSMPSFVTKVQRACQQLNLPLPDKTLLRPRNDLLHDGELAPEDDDNVSHYLELDWVVLVMVLRMVGYEGCYFHPRMGNDPILLRSQLI